jgi:hypothetical protein
VFTGIDVVHQGVRKSYDVGAIARFELQPERVPNANFGRSDPFVYLGGSISEYTGIWTWGSMDLITQCDLFFRQTIWVSGHKFEKTDNEVVLWSKNDGGSRQFYFPGLWAMPSMQFSLALLTQGSIVAELEVRLHFSCRGAGSSHMFNPSVTLGFSQWPLVGVE